MTYDQRMIRICTSLAKQGYQIHLIGRKLPQSKPFEQQLFKQKRLSCFFNQGKLFYIEYNFRLFWYLLFSKFDAVCGIDLDTLGTAYLISRLKRKKLIYDAHEYFTEVPEVVARPIVKKIWTLLECLIVPKLKYAYTVCESIADLFEEKYKTPFEVIRNVPFKKSQSIGYPEKIRKIILYQGALNEGRGLEEMIIAMQSIENADLWIAGEGDLSQQLRSQVDTLGLQNKIKFKGYISPGELQVMTSKATIGLNLLKNNGLSYYYSLANKAFDYIQSNVPAINMNFPEYQKLNAAFETAILLDDLNPDSIVQAINKLLNDATLYNRLQNNCKLASKIYNWEEEEKKLLQFYEGIFMD